MILPTKRLRVEASLLGLGAEVIHLLDRPKTISGVWEEMKATRDREQSAGSLNYEWFVLSLDLLFAIGAVSLVDGELWRAKR